MGNGIPSFWTMQKIDFKQKNKAGILVDNYVVGSSVPGVPLILIGKSAKMSWGITAAKTDVADLFRETINDEGTHYKVNGEW